MHSDSYIGKYILLFVTCKDEQGNEANRSQLHGVIESTYQLSMRITFKGKHEGKSWTIPKIGNLIEKAEPGIYTLVATGEAIDSPDYLCEITVSCHGN